MTPKEKAKPLKESFKSKQEKRPKNTLPPPPPPPPSVTPKEIKIQVMKLQKALKILEKHNKWRRGDDNYPMTQPAELGKAIDTIIKKYKKLYTKADVLKAAEMGEVNHHDAKHIVSYLDEAKNDRTKGDNK